MTGVQTCALPILSSVSIDQDGKQKVYLAETGSYNVELKDLLTGIIYMLDISIDHTAPNVVLVGVDDGGTTRENITVMGLEKGDHVDIYRGKELIFSKTATKEVTDPPYLSEPGSYRLVVSDEAGNTVEYEFTRESIKDDSFKQLVADYYHNKDVYECQVRDELINAVDNIEYGYFDDEE